jgi:type II secretory pathway pseudopilin PulG
MLRCNRGFTVAEFLVGVALMALAMGFIIPNFGCSSVIKSRYKAMEAQVKANIHEIQVALEKFAVDTGGEYPLILYGGDATDTFATSQSPPPPNDPDYDYWEGDVDVLLERGYLSEYPENPFMKHPDAAVSGRITTNPGANGLEALEINPGRVNIWAAPHDRGKEYINRRVGGKEGRLMWDVSEGQRHAPWPIIVVPTPQPSPIGFTNPRQIQTTEKFPDDYQFWLTPGNFYYYAIFDGIAGYATFVDIDGDGYGDAGSPVEGPVTGYKLAGYGVNWSAGMDVYNLHGDYPERSLFSVNDPMDPTLYVGPDGRRDGVIIVVQGGRDIDEQAGK